MNPSEELLSKYIFTRLKEDPILAQEYIYQDNVKLHPREGFKNLKKLSDNFINGKVENRFIVMPGLRGLGKTTLLFHLYDYLMEEGIEKDRILYMPTDYLTDFLGSNLMEAINIYIKEIHEKTPVTLDKKLFILIDEAQHDNKWSETGKIIYDQSKKIFMIFTGSSSINLDMSVDAVRRTRKESVFPMNFSEYLHLKYGIKIPRNTSPALENLIFTGRTTELEAVEIKIHKELLALSNPLDKEWERYLCYGGFPFSLHLNDFDIRERTFNMVERVVEKDLSSIRSFRIQTRNVIFRMLMFLALQKPGQISENKLADYLDVSSSLIKDILHILEKTHLIFHVAPYAGAGKIIRKTWKYYFLSPSIKASINAKLGRNLHHNRELLGELSENLVASYLFKLKETLKRPEGIFYSPQKGGVDFLLKDLLGGIIPLEVGIGKKGKSQIKKAINKYQSDYGIVISNDHEKVSREDDVIFLPIKLFSLI
ncbi:MAG: AAA family ATPase [Methanobacteriaceae archaeon]|nr:AAA family ATPase [Methanobacteriaceae archaeon]